MPQHKFLISGGGTGGHIFPAVAIAQELEQQYPGCEILFVGANHRMEMEKVPQEGYRIIGLDVAGLKRSLSPANLSVVWKFFKSYFKARGIIKSFNPDVVIGTGGYASLAVLYAASGMKRKTLIWEGNGYAGLTNKILAGRVNTICCGFPGMEKFFPADKIVVTGNPVRQHLLNLPGKEEAIRHFGLTPSQRVVFITGGSLGARTINQAIQKHIGLFADNGIQLIWQTGKNFQADTTGLPGIKAMPFLREMNLAYAAADAVISRAGALTLAEIAVAGKASILVPSPNVTDDHQTWNARKLSEAGAAILLPDHKATDLLATTAIDLVKDADRCGQMIHALAGIAQPAATTNIVKEIVKLVKK